MRSLKLILLAFVVLALNPSLLDAQHKLSLKQSEDSIQNCIAKLIASKTDSSRIRYSSLIIKLFENSLRDIESFKYPFNKLKNVSKLRSADSLVRIINWNIPLSNGEFIYYGFIQKLAKKKKTLSLFRLSDKSETITNPLKSELSNENWYGALYYKILTTNAGNKTYYTLLGWDGNDNFTNKKLVEAFYFEKKGIVFGPPIFRMQKGVQNRLIFEYSEQVKMMLRFDKNLKLIVFDHLSPSHKKFEGQYMYYGPDMSHDGVQFIGNSWVLKPNLNLKNTKESGKEATKKSY